MAWLYNLRLTDLLSQSRELKAEARNLRMKLQFLARTYPMRGGPEPEGDQLSHGKRTPAR